ncbi:MAG: hypothetical protein R2741_13930 [Methanolobus sp.]
MTADPEEDKDEIKELIDEALKYIKWSLEGSTGAGLLPEQVNKFTGRPAWAIPLCWSCALMLDNIMQLDEIQKKLDDNSE